MCGIVGYVGSMSPDLLPQMIHALKHRGPDDEGFHVEPGVGLGMARLAIIDLVTGRQPMATADGQRTRVFNGEIYNFRELRRDLEARGRLFATRSDTEAILAAYEAFGDACVERLRGMFAFALWDRPRRRLLLARDRLGKKPLYYWRRGDRLLFASEIKALRCAADVAHEVDFTALRHYLAFGYTPRARSIFADIAKLPPAHVAVVADGRMTLTRYWDLPPGAAGAAPSARQADMDSGAASDGPLPARAVDAASAAAGGPPRAAELDGAVRTALAPLGAREAAEVARHELREAVRLRLESDVPLGVFLSGGIDSSAIVACMREITSGPIATFSVGFGRAAPSFDEREAARVIARRFETDHHEEVLEPAVADLLPSLVDHFDEPFADSSAVPTFIVAQAAARRLKVALTGVGGDEAFGGYPRYLGVRVSTAWGRLPRPARALAAAVPRLGRESEASRSWVNWARRFVASAEAPMPDRYLHWTRFFADADLARLATPALRAHWRVPANAGAIDDVAREAYGAHGHGDPVDGAFRIDLATYVPDDLLVMTDRMSMAHSLELRAPFCDHRLLEQSLRIPPAVKMPGLRLKGLLKTAFADLLPREILTRRKQGFMIPLAAWLRGDLRAPLGDLLLPERVRARGLFEPAEVAALVQAHLAGRANHADRLWTLMIAEVWMRRYLDGHGTWGLGA